MLLQSLAQSTFQINEVEVESADAAFALGFLAFTGTFLLFAFVAWVVTVIALWKIFEKAGVEGWKAIIPVYNGWVLFEIAGRPGWWALVSLLGVIPVINLFAGIASFVLYIIAALDLAKRFGKSQAFAIVGLIIFSVVGLLILGFGDDKYTKPGTSPHATDKPATPQA